MPRKKKWVLKRPEPIVRVFSLARFLGCQSFQLKNLADELGISIEMPGKMLRYRLLSLRDAEDIMRLFYARFGQGKRRGQIGK